MLAFLSHRLFWSSLAGVSILYCIAVLTFVASSPGIRVYSFPGQYVATTADGSQGIPIVSISGLGACKGATPQPGDVLLSLAGERTLTYVDLARVVGGLRSRRIQPGATLVAGTNPDELREFREATSTVSLVEVEEKGRFAKATFLRKGSTEPDVGWVPLQPHDLATLTLSVVWFVMQSGIVLIAALAYWHRPFDPALRGFLAVSIVAMMAFVAGGHWWVISGNLAFLIPFAIAAILLPAVLLNFFLVYPAPRPLLVRRPGLVLLGVYCLPVLAALVAVATISVGSWLSMESGGNPLLRVVKHLSSAGIRELLPWLGMGIRWYLPVAAAYFIGSLVMLSRTWVQYRHRTERDQLRWILWAAAVATLPLGYALVAALVDPVSMAYGGAQLPLLSASLLFLLAYAIGIVRFRLMLIDQVLNRGVLYYVVSALVTIVCSVLLAVAAQMTLPQDLELTGQPVLVFAVLTLGIVFVFWFRDRLQRGVDREFFREKYRLDRTLRRVNQAVSGLLDRQTLADRMLASCADVLQTQEGAIYLRDGQTRRFQLVSSFGTTAFPREFEADREFFDGLRSGGSLQRVRGGDSSLQHGISLLHAELVHGLDVDGTLAGMIVLGAKPSGMGFNAEDAAFLAAIGRIAGVTLHFGRVHEDLTRMNAEFVRLNDELGESREENRRTTARLGEREAALEENLRRIELLEKQLAVRRPDATPEVQSTFSADTILGSSAAVREVMETARKVAPTNSSILIRGESGTGKELLARAIHQNSLRREGPLVTVHCAALAPGVLESELFGHVRGAFTDAREDKPGRFLLANGGTLFLDEIGDVPLETQVKLLRALQERTIEPVGSARSVAIDVRVIAATHRNLEQFIAEGRFREDLYYRLNVITITLPALRDRDDDIIALAVQFLRRAAQKTGKPVSHFDSEVVDCFQRYAWPGNVRELENVVERAVVLAEKEAVTLRDLPPALTRNGTPRRLSGPASAPAEPPLRSADKSPARSAAGARVSEPLLSRASGAPLVIGSDEERQALVESLAKAGGNKARAARLLGLPRSTYFSRLKKHGLD